MSKRDEKLADMLSGTALSMLKSAHAMLASKDERIKDHGAELRDASIMVVKWSTQILKESP